MWITAAAVLAGLAAFAAAAAVFLGGGLGAYDFGFYWQAAHLISIGHLNPVIGAIPGHTYLSDDLEFYMYPLALIYHVWSSPWLLIVTQAVAFAGVVALALRYAVDRGLDGAWFWLATVLVVAYPPASDAVGGFHWDIFAGLFGLAMLLNLLRDRVVLAVLFGFLSLLVREDAGLVVAAVSVFYLALAPGFGRAQKAALMLGLAGIASSVLAMGWLMPLLSPGHFAVMQHTMFGNASGMVGKAKAILLSFLWPAKWLYLLQLLLPLLVMPLLRPRLWPALALALSVSWLSLDVNLFSGVFQYPSAYLSVLYPATIEGLIVARRWWRGRGLSIRRVPLLPAIMLVWFIGMLAYGNQLATVVFSAEQIGNSKTQALEQERRLVGNASLLTTANDYVYVGNDRTTVIPTFVQGSALPGFVRLLGSRYIELSNVSDASTATGGVIPYVRLAERAGYRLVVRRAGTTLLVRTSRYVRPRVVKWGHLSVDARPRLVVRRSGWTIYEVKLPHLATGWWQADLRLKGRGEVYLCSMDGSDGACDMTEYVAGAAARPVGLYVRPGQPNTVYLLEMSNTMSDVQVTNVSLVRLRVL